MALDLDRATTLLARLPIIDRETGQLFPFSLKPNQWIATQKVKAHQRRLGGKIRAVYVKARRVGVSSLTEGWGTCHIVSLPNARAKIVACLADTSKELFDVPTNLIKAWPYPLPEPLSSRILIPHKAGDSLMTIMTAKTAIAGRGGRCTFLHLSEAAFFPAGGAAFTSLFNSVPDDPDTAIVVESTAYGKVGIGESFYEFWQAAVRGDNEFCAIFLTWLDDPICRRPPEGITFLDCNEDEKDIISLVACKAKCERCAKCFKALACVAWRRWAIHNLCQGRVDRFRQEYPITAEEAFYASVSQAFERDELRYARECINLAPIPKIGRLTQLLDAYGNPIKGKATFTPDPRSQLTIWEMPQENLHYYLGVDCARGIQNTDDARIREGKDYAHIAGYCGETRRQVCKFSAKIGPAMLAAILYVLGCYYNMALVAIELTGNLGLWAQSVLKDQYKYRNFYRWRGRDDNMVIKVSNSIGFEMNNRTRSLILEAFRGSLHAESIVPRDPLCLVQAEAAEMNMGDWEVPPKIHDDALVANMIAHIAMAQWHRDLPSNPETKKLLGEETRLEQGEMESAKAIMSSAKGDVELAVNAHWRRMMRLIQAAPKVSQMIEGATPNFSGSDLNRLAGI